MTALRLALAAPARPPVPNVRWKSSPFRLGLALALVGAVVSFGAGRANATAVVLVEDNRVVNRTGQRCVVGQFFIDCGPVYYEQDRPPAEFADWDSGYHQSSTVGTLLMTGSGRANNYHDVQWNEWNPKFSVVFDVVDPTEVSLTGSLNVLRGWEDDTVVARLIGPAGTVYGRESTNGLVGLDFADVLFEGRYQLEVFTDLRGGSGISGYDFDFSISSDAVPEPSTALLVGFGLALLARGARAGRLLVA